MRAGDIAAHLFRRLPELGPAGPPEPLAGGLLNHLWRVPLRSGTVVVKYAPPYLASAPEVPLDPGRITFEARALAALSPGGRLAELAGGRVRPPRLLDFDPEAAVAVMEDLGPLPHLGEALLAARRLEQEMRALGRFIGCLHAATLGDAVAAAAFDSRAVQHARHQVQYRAVGEMLCEARVADASDLGARAADLGERLQRPGRCLLMGDLWPPSVLVSNAGLRVIDWEFAHFGQPAQDLGHLAAHLWMLAHRAPDLAAASAARDGWRSFAAGYSDGAGDRSDALLDAATRRDLGLHMAAEILVRVVGPFRAGFLYDRLAPADAPVTEAVAAAAALLRAPDRAWPDAAT